MPRATSQRAGRVTPSKKQVVASGRYTAPIPRDKRHSPPWFPFVIIGLLVVGLVVIIANYAGALSVTRAGGVAAFLDLPYARRFLRRAARG